MGLSGPHPLRLIRARPLQMLFGVRSRRCLPRPDAGARPQGAGAWAMSSAPISWSPLTARCSGGARSMVGPMIMVCRSLSSIPANRAGTRPYRKRQRATPRGVPEPALVPQLRRSPRDRREQKERLQHGAPARAKRNIKFRRSSQRRGRSARRNGRSRLSNLMAPRRRPLLMPPNDGAQGKSKLDLRVALRTRAGQS